MLLLLLVPWADGSMNKISTTMDEDVFHFLLMLNGKQAGEFSSNKSHPCFYDWIRNGA